MKVALICTPILVIIFLLNPITWISLHATGNKLIDSKAVQEMNRVAEEFIVLAFSLSKTDGYYVDAYFGPLELKKKGLASSLSLQDIQDRAEKLFLILQRMEDSKLSPENYQRVRFLSRMIRAMSVHINILKGEKLLFDRESEGLYNVVFPKRDLAEFQKMRQRLDALVPGQGELGERIEMLRKKFVIPAEKVETVLKAALHEVRKRTRKWIRLPEDEKFTLELVNKRPWGAYNWFKGNGNSLIQVNTDIPLSVDQVVDVACHEGYPGHHVFNGLREKVLYRDKGWPEFSIYPLFSPMSVMSEGLANFGIELTFPDDERVKFETEILCPLAGIDPKNLELYHQINSITRRLRDAGNLIARDFLDGTLSEDETLTRIQELLLLTPESARESLELIRTIRSYILTYSIGEILVRKYILKKGGTSHPQRQWMQYLDLMIRPVLPEDLAGKQSVRQ